MTTAKISELTAAASAAATDLYEIETGGGASKKLTAAQLLTYIEGAIGTAAFRALIDDADAATQLTTLGAAPSNADYITETAQSGLSAESVLGTTVVTTATLASRQAAAKAGRIFVPSNGNALYRDTGSAWAPWGPIFPLTEPPASSWTWTNQGSATVDSTYGGIYLTAPAASGDNLRVYTRAQTGTYTIDAMILFRLMPQDNSGGGLCWRQSSDGKLVTVGLSYSSSAGGTLVKFQVNKWTNATTYSASPVNTNAVPGIPLFWRLQDNATNRIASISADGQHWHQLYSEARTTFMTADEVGIWAQSGGTTYDTGLLLASWK